MDFTNTQIAFQAKSDCELKQQRRLLRLMQVPGLSQVGPSMASWALKMGLPFAEAALRATLFRQFCGGATLEDTVFTAQHLAKFGVGSILDYGVEGEATDAGFDATRDAIIDTLRHGGNQPEVGFCAVKVSGLGSLDLLAKAQANPEGLSEAEQAAFDATYARLKACCEVAAECNMPMFVDAEESWAQDVIDQWCETLMAEFNQERPIVWTTIQFYLQRGLPYLKDLLRRAEQAGYIVGLKAVRGAYMEKEAARAEAEGYPNPVQPSKEATDADYDAAMALCLDNLDRVWLCAGTHNQASIQRLAQGMRGRGLASDDARVTFAQLYGLADELTFPLAAEGFKAFKYLPFGEVHQVLPYLLRRAEENTAIAGQLGAQLAMIDQELQRRRADGKAD